MKIQCLLKREGGTKIELFGVDYHFEPQEDGTHVAEITDKAAIERLLEIPEGYAKVQTVKAAPVSLDPDFEVTPQESPLTPQEKAAATRAANKAARLAELNS